MKITKNSLIIILILFSGCGGDFTANVTSSTTSTTALKAGESEPGGRIIFSNDNFVDLFSFANAVNTATSLSTSHQCLGDVLRVYYVDGACLLYTSPSPRD